MKNKFFDFSIRRINITLNITLFIIVLLLIFGGLWIERPKQMLKKEYQNSRVVFKLAKENIQNITQKNKDITALPEDKDLIQNTQDTNTVTTNNPVIVVVIGNLGLSKFITEKFTEMPEFITLGYSAYATNLDLLLNNASTKYHDILINLPLEPLNYSTNELGPLTLFKELSIDNKLKKLKEILNVIPSAIGVYVEHEENFTNTLEGSKFILENLNKNNKIMLHGNNHDTLLNQVANIYNYKMFDIDVRLDSVLSKAVIEQQLEKLEQIAKTKGIAIAYSNAYPILADIIPDWAAQLASKNIKILPITAVKPIVKNDNEKIIERNESEKE